MSDNPNNCEMCDHWKMQRRIEETEPEAQKLHCYMFRDAPTEVCYQHSARKALFFTADDFTPTGRIKQPFVPPFHNLPNAPIQSQIFDMVEALRAQGFLNPDLF
jgi:hypothetical protein